jgi:NADH-quinone oxidoreductase subunit M
MPLLTLMMVVPLVGAVVVAFLQGQAAKITALGTSLVVLVLAVMAWAQFDTGASAQFQLAEVHPWIPQFGVSYALGVDGIALSLIVMAAILTPICLLAAWHDVADEGRRVSTYFALMLVLETFMVGVFAATDVFLFYVFFEAMLIPVYFLIGMFGGARRQYAAMKFLLFSLAGGLIMLVAVIAVYVHGPGGEQGFLLSELIGNVGGTETAKRLMFLGFFIAGAHLAAGCRYRGPAFHGRAARRCAGQGWHLRDDPFLPAALPGGLAVGDPGCHHAGRDLGDLWRAAGHRLQ